MITLSQIPDGSCCYECRWWQVTMIGTGKDIVKASFRVLATVTTKIIV